MATPNFIAHASVSSTATAARRRSAFKIEVRFAGGLSSIHVRAFKQAAERWTRVITGDLPSLVVDGQAIDDLLIEAEGIVIDGAHNVLGQSGPTVLRSKEAGSAAYLPARGKMAFDLADLDALQEEGTLEDVIAHEMGHVLGVGTLWARKRLLVDARSSNPTYRGKHARRAYAQLKGGPPLPVPVENLGGAGTRNSHWRESVFGNELMSGFVANAPNPLSILTIASLADLGYQVDLNQAEEYQLPNKITPTDKRLVATRVIQSMQRPAIA